MKIDTSEAEKDLSLKPTACHEYKFLFPPPPPIYHITKQQ